MVTSGAAAFENVGNLFSPKFSDSNCDNMLYRIACIDVWASSVQLDCISCALWSVDTTSCSNIHICTIYCDLISCVTFLCIIILLAMSEF